jgi:hypothetical protein
MFTVETDASDAGIDAILLQDSHPIAFVSKALGPRTRGLSTYEKEYLAILLAIDQWRPYLQHAEFRILTDQRSLAHLSDQQLHTPWQQKALTKMLGLQYKIFTGRVQRTQQLTLSHVILNLPVPSVPSLLCKPPGYTTSSLGINSIRWRRTNCLNCPSILIALELTPCVMV